MKQKINVLVVGSGGREHALCWKLKASPLLNNLYVAPGNPGMERQAQRVNLKVDDLAGLLAFAQREKIDLTIVGPEYPLSLGLVDQFEAAGLKCFGPNKVAAQLESSKLFCKERLLRYGVPTPDHRAFLSADQAISYVEKHACPLVVKADGLAAGKGVKVCQEISEAKEFIRQVFSEFKSKSVLIEECLSGVEASYIVATDGVRVVPLASSHDYKRIGEGQTGHNTGGMGSVSPTPHLRPVQEEWVMGHVIKPTLQGLSREGTPFKGFLYAGLMITPEGKINVLEYNVRMGDPECQSIMRRLSSDLLELLLALAIPGSSLPPVTWHHESALCVVLAAAGYPEKPRLGDKISGLEAAEKLKDVVVFHAGTAKNEANELVTAGGRVLGLTAVGPDIGAARRLAFKAADLIKFEGRQIRRDIGE